MSVRFLGIIKISPTSAMPWYKRGNYFTAKKRNLLTFNPTGITRGKDNISMGRKIPKPFPGKIIMKDPLSIPKI